MSKDLTVKGQSEVAIPSYMKKYAGAGREDIKAELIEKSFLKMAHEPSDFAERGDFFDSATNANLGKEVVITVCSIRPAVWRKFNDDFKLEATSEDGVTWDNGEKLSEDEKWQNQFIEMFVYLNEESTDLPLILSFSGTSFRTGKKLATAIAKFMSSGDGEPIFARNYTLQTEEAKKGTKTYCLAKYSINPGFNSEAVMDKALKIREMVADITPSVTEIDPKSNLDENEVD